METILSRHWHHLSESQVLDLVETNLDRGLDLFAVENRQERFGPNAITQRKGQGPLVRFLLEFHQSLVYILLAAALITALLQEWVDSGVILGVVLVNAIIGFVEESKALKAIDALARAMTCEATVLTDDNFSSIEAASEEGRGVFDNLIKFITWTLPTNIGEGLVILVAVFAGAALPILPVQILWINMTTAVLLGLMLAFEPKEPGIMLRLPRDPASPILSRTLMSRILLVAILLLVGAFGLFEWELSHGESEAAARTAAVNVFVFGELFYLFNCRSLTLSMFAIGVFSNRWLLAGVGMMAALQLAFTYVPAMNRTFSSEPIGMTEWFLILGTGMLIYLAVGFEKWLRRRASKGRPERSVNII